MKNAAYSKIEVIVPLRRDALRQFAHDHGPAHGVGFQGRHAPKLVIELQNPQDMRQHPEGHTWVPVFQAADGLARGHGARGQILHAQGPQLAGGANVAPQALKIGGRAPRQVVGGRFLGDMYYMYVIILFYEIFIIHYVVSHWVALSPPFSSFGKY